jgi:hypothetical protein
MPLVDVQLLMLLAVLALLAIFREFLQNLLLSTFGILFPSMVSNSQTLYLYYHLLGTGNASWVQISDNEPVIELKNWIKALEPDINITAGALELEE